ncbi:Helix-hairpin-helix motif-containing protein [Cyclobacterium lianum]|uniref:Helix-hairpin-helix motif-containing protein n=2 Tax=Cyclobacterium lianum TaxID=388280 RepID=A0A1M7NBB4_9BACT|nr:Helix-hairpin-helix motif-containing protein [Cyclobacterium lianum]
MLAARQIPTGELDLESFVEERFSFQEEDIDYEDLYESLLQVHLNPLDLQEATADQLSALYILSPIQIDSFLAYRQRFGPLISVYELQAIPEWSLETIENILPFVQLEPVSSRQQIPGLSRIKAAENAYLIFRHRRIWQTRKGFTRPDTLHNGQPGSRYLGGPDDLYLRLRLQQPGDFSIGFTADKDAGEQFIWDKQTKRYGFDFLSFHIMLYDKGPWKTITLGDYQLQFGQGLVFGSGFSVGKGAETIATVRRSSLGLRPYTSVLEAGFFRGAAATYKSGNIEWTGMYSLAPRSANVQLIPDSLQSAESYLSSLVGSGLHRTPSEIQKKGQAREQNIGFNLQYQSNNRGFQIGSNLLHTLYSQPLLPMKRIYNQFEFSGRTNYTGSIYLSYNFANHYFFGESAMSKSRGRGYIFGIMSSLNPHIDLSLVWRKYDRNFHSFYGNAFAEGSRPINEEGLYLGLNFRPGRKINWSAYYDHFSFPWLKFRVYAPSSGNEWLTRFSYRPHKKLHTFIQWRAETKSRNLMATEQTGNSYLLATGKRNNFVWSLSLQPNQWWQFKSRVQHSSFTINGQNTQGFALLQDLSAHLGNWKFSGRYSVFDTDNFENRQFLYEKNVLWAFSIPALYGQGSRFYLLGQYRLNRKITVWLRWAKTVYTNRESIGTGLQEIQGNEITETTFQMRYQFNR